MTTLAIGSNDNKCSIWDISNLALPVHQFTLNHFAAVKALAFCPWSHALLATGGGRKDRTIRFWHTKSGTLVRQVHTDYQITSLIWCRSRREFAAIFGAGGTRSNTDILRIYTYPGLNCKRQTSAKTNLRDASSAVSPDGNSVCAAFSDSTIRGYNLWNPTEKELGEAGEYGSSILNAVENTWGINPGIR